MAEAAEPLGKEPTGDRTNVHTIFTHTHHHTYYFSKSFPFSNMTKVSLDNKKKVSFSSALLHFHVAN